MSNAIDDAINAARAAQEANKVAPALPSTAIATQTSGLPATQPARGAVMTLDDFTAGAMNVEQWVKVNEFGLQVGKSGDLIDEIVVTLSPDDIQVCESIKFGKNPTQYLKTYDGVSCAEGGSWEAALARANAAEPGANSYKSADICMILIGDVTDKKGEVVAQAGTRLGHSLSTTNRDNFAAFLKDRARMGLENVTSVVRVTSQKRSSNKGYVWGVLKFELIGPADAPVAEDAASE